MRAAFEKEMKELHKDLLHMGAIIEESMGMTIEALKKLDIAEAEKVMARDDEVDEMEMSIEAECLGLIYRQQPVAGDLRVIASVLKIITDMERIADNCADISEYIVKIAQEKSDLDRTDILQMAKQVKKMLKDTIDSYVEQDAEKAIATSKDDDIVDDYFEKITKQMQTAMQQSPDNVVVGTYYLFIIKYLERMGDHATNICEWIAYRVTGQHKVYN